MTDDLDATTARVRAALHAVAATTRATDDWDAVATRTPRTPGRPAVPRPLAVAAVVTVLVGVAAGGAWLAGREGDERVATGPDRTAPDPTPTGATAPPEPPADPGEGPVSLWLSADRVPAGSPVELVAVLVSRTEQDLTFGVAAAIERWDGTAWVPHRFVALCLDHWHCTATPEPLGGVGMGVPSIGLTAAVGQPGPPGRFSTTGLDPGWYRMTQTANEGVAARGRFAVVAGAPAPAPLAPLDGPAISVGPALVPVAGRSVTLLPLVPPVGGNQTLEDVQEATAGLGASAAVERWVPAERRWEHVTEVAVPAPGPDVLEVTVALPPLPGPGDYRLVRSGPNGDHTGRFWAVDGVPGVAPG